MVDALPGDIRDVEQAVDAAEIDESAVVGQVLHHALEHLAFLQAGDEFGTGFRTALLEHGAARHHDVAAGAIHLQDLERLRRAHQRADIAHRTDVHLAAGQEGHGAGEVDGEAALHAAEDHAGDALVLLEVPLELRPGFFAARLLAAEHGFAMLVFHALEIDLDQIADLDLGLLSGRGEFLEGDPPFRLQAHIDQHGVGFDRDDGALDHGAFEAARSAEGFLQQRGKILFGLLYSSGGFSHLGKFLSEFILAGRLYPAVWQKTHAPAPLPRAHRRNPCT